MKRALLLIILALPIALSPMKQNEFELQEIKEPKQKSTFDPQEALYRAAYNGEVNTVSVYLFCKTPADTPEYTGKIGWTPLCAAAYNGHTSIVRMLLGKGADIWAKTPDGSNPLLLAARKNHPEIINELVYYLDSSPDVTNEHIKQYLYSSDKSGNTVFSIAPKEAKDTLLYWLKKLTGNE